MKGKDRIIYNDNISSFKELLEKDASVTKKYTSFCN